MRIHNPPHPGEIIKSLCLEPLDLSVTEAAKALGVSSQQARWNMRVTHSTRRVGPAQRIECPDVLAKGYVTAVGYPRLSVEETLMARLTSITGKSQVPAEHHPIVDAIVESRGSVHGPFTMLLHCPPLAGRLAPLGAYVRFEGKLDKRVRVLAAMTVAREFDAVYVWGAQTGAARRQGVPEATIAAIREKHSRGIPAHDAQIVEFTRDLIRKHRVDAASMKALQQRFGDEQFIELTGTIGYYSMLAMTVNACELEAGAGAEVLQG